MSDGKEDDPWLRIPAADYEAHMSAIGQSAAGRMSLRNADEIARIADEVGFRPVRRRDVDLPGGKTLASTLLAKA